MTTPAVDPLYQGTVAPDTYPVVIAQGDSGLDMTTVTSGLFFVEQPDGTVVTWAASISGASTTQLTLTHDFAVSPSDLPVNGRYVIYARLTVPGGFKTTTRIVENVKGAFEP